MESLGNRSKQRAILRAVYEENLRITEKGVIEAPPSERRRRRRRTWPVGTTVAVVLTAVVVAAASLLYRNLTAPPPPVAEQVARAVDTPAVFVPVEETDLPGVPAASEYQRFLNNPTLPIASLFDLQVQTIVIDPGHGGRDPGAVSEAGTREKDLTLDVALRLRQRLQSRHGYHVLMTREWDDSISLQERAAFANTHGADLFISLHVNYLPTEPVTSIETYYFGPQSDEETLLLARRENRESDYTLAEFQDVIRKIGNTVKLQESQRLAVSIQKTLYRNIRMINHEVSNWGVRSAPFVVLMDVEAPAVLAEIAVLSNHAEEAQLNTATHRERLAAYLEAGVVNYLNQDLQPNEFTEGATEDASEKE